MAQTITDIEICSVGMDWRAATGVHSVTFENVRDAYLAFQDPHIQPPRGKVGHFSDLNEGIPMWDPFAKIGDAAPALGVYTNLRLTNNGATLMGDAVEVPDWIKPGTYPNRSMEAVHDVTTPGGKKYSMVVTAVAWLGEELPAISDLEDITVNNVADLAAFIEKGPAGMAQGVAASTAMSVSISKIRADFRKWADDGESFAGADTYWWWVRDVRMDPNELIVDDDEGGLWRVPFSTDGEFNVTFKTPVQVIENFVDAPEPAQVAASAFPGKLVATFSRPKGRTRSNNNASSAGQGEQNMDPRVAEFLRSQGLDPDQASEDQIKAAEAFLGTVPQSKASDDTTTSEPPADPVVDEPVGDPIAAAQDRRLAALEKENADLRSAFAREQEEKKAAKEAADKSRRDDKIAAFKRSGQLTAAEESEYRHLMDLDEDRVTNILASRPTSVPLEEIGKANHEDPLEAAFKADEPLPAGLSLLTPAERRMRDYGHAING